MASRHSFRPENVLRRAEDLINVDQSEAALQTLYEFLTRKKRSVIASELEPIALLFVQLGVDLNNGKVVKDGLHQYKKAIQSVEGGLESISTVVKKFIELSENKLSEAQVKADAAAEAAEAAATGRSDDIEDEDDFSPEEFIMASVSIEETRDRSDRDLVSPWIKYCWEAYRTVLDIVRNNSRLEVTYIAIANQAFNFCITYNRKPEFRRLCDLLRTHLQSITNNDSHYSDSIELSDADTFQRFIDNRFQQLNVSVKLELWQESFRTVEDIHNLMSNSKRQPKPSMMINYYENLAKIFTVSNNDLFHAAARQKFYNLFSQSPIATDEELSKFATLQVISALSVPILNSTTSEALNDDFMKRKNNRLTSLLNLSKVPTRDILINQASDKSILNIVNPTVVELFKLLENDFHPLVFGTKSKELFKTIASNDDLKVYVKPLTEVVLFKLVKQVSEVYESIKLDYLIKLATFEDEFYLSPIEIESFLLKTAKEDSLFIKIDHESKVVSFKSDPFDDSLSYTSETLQASPVDLIRNQLTNLARSLNATMHKIDPSIQQRLVSQHQRALQAANNPETGFYHEKELLLSRETILEEKRRELIKIKREEEEEASRIRAEKALAAQEEERKRIQEEEEKKIIEKRKRELEEIAKAEKQSVIDKINAQGVITIDSDEAKDLDTEKIRAMQLQKLAENKKQLDEKVESISKKFTYIERAQRKFELPLWAKDAEVQKEKDVVEYEAMKKKIVENAKKEHQQHVSLRDRLKKIVPEYQSISEQVKAQHAAELAKAKAEAAEKLAAAKQERIAQAIAAKKAQLEAELAAKEEAEKLAKAQAEKEAAREAARIQREAQFEADRKKREEAQAQFKAESSPAPSRYVPPTRRGAGAGAGDSPFGRSAGTPAASPFSRASPAAGSPTPTGSPSPAPAADAPKKFTFKRRERN